MYKYFLCYIGGKSYGTLKVNLIRLWRSLFTNRVEKKISELIYWAVWAQNFRNTGVHYGE